ncbi:flavin reductase family protein [Streptomyces sp. NBRC 109706]|uniref:flavin reductase family protein n=1 Tax=Streptomyces sp. NBRC 109706 TaxID=1550035 RepID=UPI00082CBCF9|nr:flavin reductase family protein [Streptomyces sp. NBRC 109706]
MELDLRAVMRHFTTGVGVVSTHVTDADAPGGRRHDAITVNSLAPVSEEPPLVSFCLRNESVFLTDLLTAGVWAVSVLDAEGARTAGRLAKPREARAETLPTLPTTPGAHTGALIVDGLGWLECATVETFDAGDHRMVIGRVLGSGLRPTRRPLLFLRGALVPGPALVEETAAVAARSLG